MERNFDFEVVLIILRLMQTICRCIPAYMTYLIDIIKVGKAEYLTSYILRNYHRGLDHNIVLAVTLMWLQSTTTISPKVSHRLFSII